MKNKLTDNYKTRSNIAEGKLFTNCFDIFHYTIVIRDQKIWNSREMLWSIANEK